MSPVSEPETNTDLGQVLSVLSDRYRRELLVALLVENPQDEDDRDPLNCIDPPFEPEVLEVELFHTHLPKLEAMGFIEWDRAAGTVSKGPNWDEVEPVLRLIYDHRDELPSGWL